MGDKRDHPRETVHDGFSDSENDKVSSTYPPVSKSSRVRNLAKRTKQKTKNVLDLDKTPTSEPEHESEQENLFADPAFNPNIVLNSTRAPTSASSSTNTKDKLKAASDQDRDLLAAYDELNEVISSQSSAQRAETPGWDSDEFNARRKVERVEEARENRKIAGVVGRHVRRVRVVEKMSHRPRKEEFIEKDASGSEKWRWDIWIAKLALYYTQGFTAQYIDDFEQPPFEVKDLARIIERISLTSAPWQAWLIDVRRVYTWEEPRRTSKWMVLYWTLWYTEHIMGYPYAYIIYTVLRNWFYPDSVESVRQAYARSVDQTLKAQAWGELVEKAGHEDWIEPLQLVDAADYLEILTNFYKWASPRKTAATLWFFFVCLLITLVGDMAFCMKIVWFIIGGSFFFTYPIATRFPQYRRLVSAWRWFVWDVPTDAEWSIRKLQEKALMRQANVLTDKERTDERRHSDSSLDYSTPESSPSRLPARIADESWRFHVYQGAKSGSLVITRRALTFKLRPMPWRIPFVCLKEVRKVPAAKKTKARALQPDLASIELYFLDEEAVEQCEVVSMAQEIRHEVFSLMLGISGLRWRVLQMERHQPSGDEHKADVDNISQKHEPQRSPG